MLFQHFLSLCSKCKHFFDRVAMPKLNSYFQQKPKDFFTLCHGDFWSNNILFHYKDGDDEERDPQDLILIDFQLINYGHPAYDLVSFFCFLIFSHH